MSAIKNKIYLFIGLCLIFIPIMMPVQATNQLLCVFAGSIFLWITCPIEIGSLACIIGLALLPEVSINTLFTSSFGSSTIIFLIFSMLLTYGLSETGVLKRIAFWFINNPIAHKNKYTFLGFYFLSMLIIGSVIAPTTLFVLFFGIANEIYNCMNLEKGDPLARAIMIGTGFFASISCAMTPIAHTFPIMALGYYEELTGTAINYITYMKYSIPIGIILAGLCYMLLCCIIKNKEYNFNNYLANSGAWSFKEISSIIIFILVICMWLITGIWPNAFSALNKLGTAFPAIFGCVLLAIMDCLDIKKGMKNGVSWSAILLCAATLALGKVINMDEFGIVSLISNFIGDKVSILLIICFSIILTNCISNIVTTTLAFNIFIPAVAINSIVNPVVGTIAIGMGASLAYALPSSIAHIALAGSSGWATTKDMIKYGIIMIIFSILVMGVAFIYG